MNMFFEFFSQVFEFIGAVLELPGAILLDLAGLLHNIAIRNIIDNRDGNDGDVA